MIFKNYRLNVVNYIVAFRFVYPCIINLLKPNDIYIYVVPQR